MKLKILFTIATMLFAGQIFSQTIPTIYVDGDEVIAPGIATSAPYWLNAGQTLGTGTKVISINVIQFIKVAGLNGGYTLEMDVPLTVTDPYTSPLTVPAGKVWKIETAGFDKTASTSVGDNLGNHVATTDLNMSSFKINNLNDPAVLTDAVNASTVQNSEMNYALDGGAANAYSVTLSPAPTSYAVGMMVIFKATNSNTGASTLDVNGLGAVTIKKQGIAEDLISGDILAGRMVTVVYDGTYFEMTGQLSNPAGGTPHGKQMFTSNGTFNAPIGVVTVYVSISGGGGGGGGNGYNSSYGAYSPGGGGGGAHAVMDTAITVVPGNSYTVTVGTGGAGGTGKNPGTGSGVGVSGTNGGNSSFDVLLTVNGGSGGAGGPICNNTCQGGTGGNAGGPGGVRGKTGFLQNISGNLYPFQFCDGGGSMFGAGGAATQTVGVNGGLYGAGGSGAVNGTGGNGANGFVLVEW